MSYRLTCKTASEETCREVGTRESVKGDYRKTYSKINKNTAYKSFNLQHTHISDSPLGKPQILTYPSTAVCFYWSPVSVHLYSKTW